MAHQLLRRPVLGCRAPAALPCPAQIAVTRTACNRLPIVLRISSPLRPQQSTVNRRVIPQTPCLAAAESEVADPMERPRSRFLFDTSPEIIDSPDAPELPMPSEYQQTLWTSFALAGIGLHTGEYACVRVRPAFAGEGRYFVRVAEGTNAPRAMAGADMDLQEEIMEDISTEEGLLNDPEYRQELVTAYQEYVDAQEEEGFGGSFVDYLQAQEYTDLVQRLEEQGPPKFPFSQAEEPQPRDEGEVYVPASCGFVYEANPITTTVARGNFQVAGVESLLSALEACGVDNARIEIEGGDELPVLDGSAEGWTDEICRAGLRYAPTRPDLTVALPPGALGGLGPGGEGEEGGSTAGARGGEGQGEEEGEEGVRQGGVAAEGRPVPKLVLRPQSVVSVVRGSSFVTLYPEDTFRITAGLDRHREAPVIGKQWLTWCMFEDVHYKHALSGARGFVSSPEQAMGMRDAGWLMGGTEGVMLIALDDRWYDPDLVRHADEPARRQIQDLIGDLSLLARDGHSGLPCGHIVSYNADHELNVAFVEKLLESTRQDGDHGDWVPIRNVAGPSLPVELSELMSDVIAEPGELGAGEEDEEEEEEEGAAAAGEYDEADEEEVDEYGEAGEFEEYEDEEGVVDVEATEVEDPRKRRGGGGGGGGMGRRRPTSTTSKPHRDPPQPPRGAVRKPGGQTNLANDDIPYGFTTK
ncbi:hypothetical protein VOLCADRAFT_105382 [Volvox carteri f. nagariensis]|uniref:UDP-3-O-acyl-N-acetylglucosamine deacetylase n=1 Tax=Volvox carteri f. nagariensis TaxID=3068 RepID=D8U0G8_VOLCA|nr:uncharacterized protein VOLCADRAFT_105382 [Volvox carteri f. nagariensis]EFJ46631.1 hypothetical protein VOLCADRAFT_105382 [Volvox carteri f. nagariensis]|eukprot:XP_002952160.1 hypothetical protein VOLCADRAFT_105382 [Volvox carteri f. nagariensis]